MFDLKILENAFVFMGVQTAGLQEEGLKNQFSLNVRLSESAELNKDLVSL